MWRGINLFVWWNFQRTTNLFTKIWHRKLSSFGWLPVAVTCWFTSTFREPFFFLFYRQLIESFNITFFIQDIVIGTPGRIQDLIEMGFCCLKEVSFVVSGKLSGRILFSCLLFFNALFYCEKVVIQSYVLFGHQFDSRCSIFVKMLVLG